MKIKELIDELYKELNRGDEEIFIEDIQNKEIYYDFDIGLDINGQPMFCSLKRPLE